VRKNSWNPSLEAPNNANAHEPSRSCGFVPIGQCSRMSPRLESQLVNRPNRVSRNKLLETRIGDSATIDVTRQAGSQPSGYDPKSDTFVRFTLALVAAML
jgi:hypothetical protein